MKHSIFDTRRSNELTCCSSLMGGCAVVILLSLQTAQRSKSHFMNSFTDLFFLWDVRCCEKEQGYCIPKLQA